jgi:hypothetical protein
VDERGPGPADVVAYPLWSRDGRELFYLQPGATIQLISVPIEAGLTDSAFTFGTREELLEWPYFTGNEGRNYDVSLDGQRFFAITTGGATGVASSREITVVTNWFTELRARMGEN